MIFIDADTLECVGTILITMSISYCRGINMISCPRTGYHIYRPVISPSYHGNGRQIYITNLYLVPTMIYLLFTEYDI